MKKISIQIMCIVMLILLPLCSGCAREEISVIESTSEEQRGYAEEPVQDGSDYVLTEESVELEALQDSIVVHVCGAVKCEGVYELPQDSRASDALNAAGGFAENADTSYVNLAESVRDGQKLYFPEEGETAGDGMPDTGGNFREESFLVNINTADVSALTGLPGIGSTRAERIVEYRDTHGGFASKEELKNVNGIGDSIYENLEAYISVD